MKDTFQSFLQNLRRELDMLAGDIKQVSVSAARTLPMAMACAGCTHWLCVHVLVMIVQRTCGGSSTCMASYAPFLTSEWSLVFASGDGSTTAAATAAARVQCRGLLIRCLAVHLS